MKERPIIFNSEMVKAILDGRKTQTRRVMKSQPRPSESRLGDYWFPCKKMETMVHVSEFNPATSRYPDSQDVFSECCPFGAIGDRLWVRETFALGLCTESTLAYNATHKPEDLEDGWFEKIKWTPSIHMPRWASRINLEITNVRVERLNAISEEDALAEGCKALEGCKWHTFEEAKCGTPMHNHTAKDAFSALWQSIYGEENWSSNPWVWVVEFKQGGAT